MPVTLPQSLFGYTKKHMNPLTKENFAWVAVILLITIILYFAFRFKNKETRYMICVFLALYLFHHYNSIYLMDMKLSRLPFQLCNLGSYLVLISLLIKKQSFFNAFYLFFYVFNGRIFCGIFTRFIIQRIPAPFILRFFG